MPPGGPPRPESARERTAADGPNAAKTRQAAIKLVILDLELTLRFFIMFSFFLVLAFRDLSSLRSHFWPFTGSFRKFSAALQKISEAVKRCRLRHGYSGPRKRDHHGLHRCNGFRERSLRRPSLLVSTASRPKTIQKQQALDTSFTTCDEFVRATINPSIN